MTVITAADIATAVLTGIGVSLLVTVPVVLVGYGFRLVHLFK